MIEQRIINLGHRLAEDSSLPNVKWIYVVDEVFINGTKQLKAFGFYDIINGTIQVRVKSRHEIPRRLSDKSIHDTLCHELAHSVHINHTKEFKKLKRHLRARLTDFLKEMWK